jgi:hypothetical protein
MNVICSNHGPTKVVSTQDFVGQARKFGIGAAPARLMFQATGNDCASTLVTKGSKARKDSLWSLPAVLKLLRCAGEPCEQR